MGGSDSLAWTSLALALAVVAIAALLGLRVWWERRTRDPGLSEPDRRHFRNQDLRRGFGVALLTFLALGVYVGSRLPAVLNVMVPPRPGPERHANPLFLALWLAVSAAVIAALVLALVDWSATQNYARRHRREIDRQRAEVLREAIRQARVDDEPASPNGPPAGPL